MKQRRLLSLLTAITVLVGCAIAAPAAASSDDEWYSLIYEQEGEEKVLTGYVGPLPDRVDIANGTTIVGEGALKDNGDLRSVCLPNGLKEIRAHGIYNTSFCGTLDLPRSMETLGDYAVAYNSNMDYVIMYGSIKYIAPTAFSGCNGIQSIWFRGTREDWDRLNIQLPDTKIAVAGDDFSIWHEPGTEVLPPKSQIHLATQAIPDVASLNLTLTQDSGYICEDGHSMALLDGIVASNKAISVQDLIGNLSTTGNLEYRCAHESEAYQVVGTGDRLILTDPITGEVHDEAVLLLHGDVLGTGAISIGQVVRIAKAVNGVEALEGIYQAAADLNSDGKVDIADLVGASRLLNAEENAA